MKRLTLLIFSILSSLPLLADDPTEAIEQTTSALADPSSYEHTLIKMLLTLGGLVALVLLTVFVLKKLSHGRLSGFGTQKKIMILERKPISPKTVLYYVELEGKKILLAESQIEVRQVMELSQDEDF